MRLNLFAKLAHPILMISIFGITILSFYIPRLIEKDILTNVVTSSAQTAKQFKGIRGYYTKNIIKKVLQSADIRPAIEHNNIIGKIPLPATMIHDLSVQLRDSGLSMQLYSPFPFPGRSSRKLDDFQLNAWEVLNKDPDAILDKLQIVNGQPIISVAVSDTMVAQGCVDCHNSRADTPKNDWKLNDVRGILQIDTNIESLLAAGRLTSMKIIGTLLIVLIIMLLSIFVIFRRTIGSRINDLVKAMEEIATGDADLTQRIPETGDDEIASLTQTFNRFLEKLQSIISETSNVTEDVNSLSKNMRQASDNISTSIDSQGTEIESIISSMDDIVENGDLMSDNAVNALDSAKKANISIVNGKQVVDNTTQAINSLSDELQVVGESMSELRSETDQVGSVIQVISGIADQTNLLALNAAIEAARAGDTGRGFAVVADEVRSLASRTQASTKEIQDMMDRLQAGAEKAVIEVEHSKDKAQECTVIAGKASESLDEISNDISGIMQKNKNISDTANQQKNLSIEIQASLKKIAEIAQGTTNISDRSAGDSDELAQMIKNLREQIGKFTT
ncbi:MAG: HAMP domain-containing protein [Oceanospirillaceae bacterium]|nr:HAMP domain-containing protein [Oceanospirillaceae bacterium]